MISEMSAKHAELLKEAVPSLAKLAVLWNPTNSSHRPALQATEVAARSLSLQVHPLEVRSPAELDNIFAAIVRERADGLLFIADPIFSSTLSAWWTFSLRTGCLRFATLSSFRNSVASWVTPRASRMSSGMRRATLTKSSKAPTRRAGRAADEISARDQSQDRQGARPHDPPDAACHRRRGDRIEVGLLRLLTAGFGTSAT